MVNVLWLTIIWLTIWTFVVVFVVLRSFCLQTKAGNTALHMAYQQFHLPVIRILEKNGADKLVLNKKGLTPAKMLYLKGNKNHKLRLACQFGDVSGAAYFIEKGADINSASKKTGATPLMDACWAGNKEIVNLLMVCGADISLKNNRKNTALHLAIQRGFSELIPILMKGLHADKAAKVKNYIGLKPEDLGRLVASRPGDGMYSDDLSKVRKRLKLALLFLHLKGNRQHTCRIFIRTCMCVCVLFRSSF